MAVLLVLQQAELLATSFMTEEGTPGAIWSREVGPFVTSATLARRLRITPEEVEQRVGRSELLALPTADGHILFPLFQLRANSVVPGLTLVLKPLLQSGVDPWSVAAWLLTDQPSVGRSVVELLEQDIDTAVALAHVTARRWTAP